jgi:hypothetical protein
LARPVGLGSYGECFGQPLFRVEVTQTQLRRLEVVRGAPCGATWALPQRLEGMPVTTALEKIGLATQFFCVADPAGWDPISGRQGDRSPVHLAGELHRAAFIKALSSCNQ